MVFVNSVFCVVKTGTCVTTKGTQDTKERRLL